MHNKLIRQILSTAYLVLLVPSLGLLYFALTFSTDTPYGLPVLFLQTLLGFGLPPLFLLIGGAGGWWCSVGKQTSTKEKLARVFVYLPLISLIMYVSYFFLY